MSIAVKKNEHCASLPKPVQALEANMHIATKRQRNPFFPDPQPSVLSASDFYSLKTDIIVLSMPV